ncbi:hypothetical protein ACNF42_00355 [Cuniculiplasma sp. SKW3]|uniref:hypothetical protein n=1 Tax=Cuniculiplasma sp. SKW3 TaxID=3400170 RepID=UPI003FD31C8E
MKALLIILVVSLMMVPVAVPYNHSPDGAHMSFGPSPGMNISMNGGNTTMNFFGPNFLRFYSNEGFKNVYPHLHWHMTSKGKLNYSYHTNVSGRIGLTGISPNSRNNFFKIALEYQNITVNITKVSKILEMNGTNNTTLTINDTNSLSVSYQFSIHDTRNLSGDLVIPIAIYQGKGFKPGMRERFDEKRMKMNFNGLVMPFNQTRQTIIFSLNSHYVDNGQEMNATIIFYHVYRFYVYYLIIPYSGKYNNISYDPYVTLPSSFPLKTVDISTPITQAIGEIESNLYAFGGGIILGSLLIGAGYISYRKKSY